MKKGRPPKKDLKKEIIALVDSAGLNYQQVAERYGKKDRQWAMFHYKTGKKLSTGEGVVKER
jgi:hypothetical protein